MCIATDRLRHTKTQTQAQALTHNTHSMRKQTDRDTDRTTHRKIGTATAITDRSDGNGRHTDSHRQTQTCPNTETLPIMRINIFYMNNYDICLECLKKMHCALAKIGARRT